MLTRIAILSFRETILMSNNLHAQEFMRTVIKQQRRENCACDAYADFAPSTVQSVERFDGLATAITLARTVGFNPVMIHRLRRPFIQLHQIPAILPAQ